MIQSYSSLNNTLDTLSVSSGSRMVIPISPPESSEKDFNGTNSIHESDLLNLSETSPSPPAELVGTDEIKPSKSAYLQNLNLSKNAANEVLTDCTGYRPDAYFSSIPKLASNYNKFDNQPQNICAKFNDEQMRYPPLKWNSVTGYESATKRLDELCDILKSKF